jgi:hypothetical protein
MDFPFILDGFVFSASAEESIVVPSKAPSNDDDDDNDGGENTAKLDAVLYKSVEKSRKSNGDDGNGPFQIKGMLLPSPISFDFIIKYTVLLFSQKLHHFFANALNTYTGAVFSSF